MAQRKGGPTPDSAPRQLVTVRMPDPLIRKLDRLVERERRERGTKWSRNDEICLLLAAGVLD